MVHQYARNRYGWDRLREQRGRKHLRTAAGAFWDIHVTAREPVPQPCARRSVHTTLHRARREILHPERLAPVCCWELILDCVHWWREQGTGTWHAFEFL